MGGKSPVGVLCTAAGAPRRQGTGGRAAEVVGARAPGKQSISSASAAVLDSFSDEYGIQEVMLTYMPDGCDIPCGSVMLG